MVAANSCSRSCVDEGWGTVLTGQPLRWSWEGWGTAPFAVSGAVHGALVVVSHAAGAVHCGEAVHQLAADLRAEVLSHENPAASSPSDNYPLPGRRLCLCVSHHHGVEVRRGEDDTIANAVVEHRGVAAPALVHLRPSALSFWRPFLTRVGGCGGVTWEDQE